MAYQLKTTGIAANCTMCIAVDPDTSTIKDFASSTVTADMLIGANVTTGSQSWDGNTRHYFVSGTGTADADFVKFGTTKPSFGLPASSQRTVVWIGDIATDPVRVFGNDSSNYFASRSLSGGTTHPIMILGGISRNGALTNPTSGKKIFGLSFVQGTSTTAYSATDTDASMTTVALSSMTSNAGYSLDYVGRRDDATTHGQEKHHAILIFNTALTEAQWDSLRDDWFGTLLEAAGGGDATAAGTTLTATASLTAGSASATSNAEASGVTLTATASLIAGSASATGDSEAAGVTLTATSSLIAGSASGAGNATADGVTFAVTSSLVAGSASGVINGVLNFQAAGMEFGSRTGLGIDTFGLENGKSYRYSVHADGLTLGAAILTSAAITLDSAGKLPNLVTEQLSPGTTYRIFAIRQSDGEAATFRMTAA